MAITQSMYPTLRYEGKDWAGLTTSNNLGYLFGEEPIKINKFIESIYKVNLQEEFVSRLSQYPVEYLPDDREYEWMLIGGEGKNIPLESATDIAGNAFTAASTPGKYREPFYMYFGEKLFFQTHVIVGNKVDLYHLLVLEDPVQIGTSFRIKVQLVNGDDSAYIPYAQLEAGTRWSADYSLSTQILSDTGSDISFNSPMKMANRISMLRKKTLVPGDMIIKGKNDPVVWDWQIGSDGGQAKKFTTWINRLDWQFDREFRRERAHLLLFGKSNRRPDGTFGNFGNSGYETKAGAGLRDQISAANKFYYNVSNFNVELLVDFALGMSVGKIPEDSRSFLVGTGEYGLTMVSRAIEKYSGAAKITMGQDFNRVNAISGPVNKATFTRPQFVKFIDINGIRFEFIHIPEYDDTKRNKEYHPDGGLIESRRLTIMDFGTQNGNPNTQLVRVKGQEEVFRYIPGLRDPFSAGGNGKASMTVSPIDGYEIHKADWCGIKVNNPMRMGEFIPNFF